jgi:hypothetical protein
MGHSVSSSRPSRRWNLEVDGTGRGGGGGGSPEERKITIVESKETL